MASHLARAARRLCGSTRGLSDVLTDARAATRSGRQLGQRQQPWALAMLRLRSDGGADGTQPDAVAPPSADGSSLEPRIEEALQASSSSSDAPAEVEAAAAALRARPPAGHTDFQQRQLLMLFTCSRCNMRAAKAFSKQAYQEGVVIVECPGCHNKHLIADNLGWFGQKGTVEEFAAERGSTVVRQMADGTVELSPEDLLGQSLVEAVAATVASGGSTHAAPAQGVA